MPKNENEKSKMHVLEYKTENSITQSQLHTCFRITQSYIFNLLGSTIFVCLFELNYSQGRYIFLSFGLPPQSLKEKHPQNNFSSNGKQISLLREFIVQISLFLSLTFSFFQTLPIFLSFCLALSFSIKLSFCLSFYFSLPIFLFSF
jgi:hypothetical protein